MTSAEILDKVLIYLKQGTAQVSLRYALTLTGCILMSLFLSLLLVRKRRKGFYSFKEDTPLRYHYALMAILPVAAVLVFLRCHGTSALLSAAAVLAVILALAADLLLFKWKWRGVVLADLSLIADTAVLHVWIRGIISSTFSEIMGYSPAGIYSLLGACDLWTFYADLMAAAAAVIIVVNAAYYAKRYYLFFPGELKGLARCAYCGRPVFADERYCPNCGKPLPEGGAQAHGEATQAPAAGVQTEGGVLPEGGPKASDPDNSGILLARLEKGSEKYCSKCGTLLRNGVCRNCGTDYRKLVKDKAIDAGKDMSTKVGIVAFFIVIAIIPTFFSKALDLASGSAVIHNAYVEKLSEYLEDHSKAADGDWLADYLESYGALIRKDQEWIEVPYRSLSRSNIPFYVSYAEAACGQSEVMEDINASVLMSAEGKSVNEETLQSQIAYFNATVEDMRDASYAGSRLTSGGSTFSKFFHIVLDGIRYWTAKLPALLPAALMILCGIASFALLAADLSGEKSPVNAVFGPKAYQAFMPWLRGLLNGNSGSAWAPDKGYVRGKRLTSLLTIGLAALCFAIPAFMPGILGDEDDAMARYVDSCKDVLLTSMQEEQYCVNELLRSSEELTKEKIGALSDMLKNSAARAEAYLAAEDIPEGCEAVDVRMDGLCREDIALLSDILSALEKNERPERDVLVRLAGLRLREYGDLTQWYYQMMLESTFSSLTED